MKKPLDPDEQVIRDNLRNGGEYDARKMVTAEFALGLQRELTAAKTENTAFKRRVNGELSEDCPFCKLIGNDGTSQQSPMCYLCQLESERDSLHQQLEEAERRLRLVGFYGDNGKDILTLELAVKKKDEALKCALANLPYSKGAVRHVVKQALSPTTPTPTLDKVRDALEFVADSAIYHERAEMVARAAEALQLLGGKDAKCDQSDK